MDELTPETEEQGLPFPPPAARRRYAVIVIAALVVLVVALLVRRQDVRTDETEAAAPPRPATDIIEATPDQLKQIEVERVRDQMIDLDLETTGKVGFNEDRMTPVFAPYGGRVVEVLANKGDVVKAGQPLLIIESPDLIAALNDLTEARSAMDKARIAADAAEKGAERARNLHSLEALATKELQAAEAELAQAREDYRRASTAVSVMRNKLALFGKSSDEIKQLEDSVIDQIDRRIEIRAPLSGTIVDRKVGPGQYIKPDAPDPLYLIGDLSVVWVNADVYETQLAYVRPGSPVIVTVAAYSDRQFPARIASINPTVDPATRVVRVRCLVPNPAGLLKPEMFASINIGNAEKRKVFTVPSTAVLTQAQHSFVLREESQGRFRRWQVRSGREIQGYTVIEEGLNSNDRVVTAGALLLSNGLGESGGK